MSELRGTLEPAAKRKAAAEARKQKLLARGTERLISITSTVADGEVHQPVAGENSCIQYRAIIKTQRTCCTS